MLSDVEIQEAINDKKLTIKELIIKEDEEKCEELKEETLSNCLQPCGYDLRIGHEAFSWKEKRIINIQSAKKIKIAPDDLVVIRTREYIKLSKNLSATIHSMATKTIKQGLSHISTIIDPSYEGTLLIAIRNNSREPISLDFKETFCTVCFYNLDKPNEKNLPRENSRSDIWEFLKNIAKQEEENKAKIFVYLTIFYIIFIISLAIIKQFKPVLINWIPDVLNNLIPNFQYFHIWYFSYLIPIAILLFIFKRSWFEFIWSNFPYSILRFLPSNKQ